MKREAVATQLGDRKAQKMVLCCKQKSIILNDMPNADTFFWGWMLRAELHASKASLGFYSHWANLACMVGNSFAKESGALKIMPSL